MNRFLLFHELKVLLLLFHDLKALLPLHQKLFLRRLDLLLELTQFILVFFLQLFILFYASLVRLSLRLLLNHV